MSHGHTLQRGRMDGRSIKKHKYNLSHGGLAKLGAFDARTTRDNTR